MVGEAIIEAWERRDAEALDTLLVQRRAAGQVRAAVRSWNVRATASNNSVPDEHAELVLALCAALCRRIRTQDLVEDSKMHMLCVWFTALITEHLELFCDSTTSPKHVETQEGSGEAVQTHVDLGSISEHLARECRMLYADLMAYSTLELDQAVRKTTGRLEILNEQIKRTTRASGLSEESDTSDASDDSSSTDESSSSSSSGSTSGSSSSSSAPSSSNSTENEDGDHPMS